MLDNQHKHLLSICDSIDELTKIPSVTFNERFHEILNELIKYAEIHFRDEEKLLEAHDFPELIIHRKGHDEYFNDLSLILFNALKGEFDINRLGAFTNEWWINHILHSDMKYKPYFK